MVETAGPELVIQAGTATSTRVRGEETQSFNWIHIPAIERIELSIFGWNGNAFGRGKAARFARSDSTWQQVSVVA
jgi:hypothetical protein